MEALECAVPMGATIINFGVDFQIDRCELEFIGWGEGEETWGLGYVVLPGDYSVLYSKGQPWAFDQLESILTRQFVREDGARMTAKCGGFDTGYSAVQRALYQYLRPRLIRRYFPLKGANTKWAPIWTKGRRDDRITLFLSGTNRAKSLVYQRASISTPGPGFMHFPQTDDYGDEYFKQLLAEDSYTMREAGTEMRIFEMPSTPTEDGSSRNEVLDIRVASIVALSILGPINWEAEEKKNLATIPSEEETTKQVVRLPSRNNRGGLGRGWKV